MELDGNTNDKIKRAIFSSAGSYQPFEKERSGRIMNLVDLIPMILVIGVFLLMLIYLMAYSYDIRALIGKVTSPVFVPLRKFVVWGDKKFGTCDMRLTLEPRRRDEDE